jgi:uncharacterized protein
MIAQFTLLKLVRAPATLLRLIAIANTLFFASFLLALLAASSQAHAGDIECVGQNLMETLDAKVLAEIDSEAAKTINGQSRLWKIEKPGMKSSWLFGTMHATDKRVTALSERAQAAFDAADIVVIETTEVLDQAKAATALLARPDLMMFTDATTLTSLVDPKDMPALEKGLTERGLALAAINKMKPWMVSSMLAIPACETLRIQAGSLLLDVKLGKDAQKAGKQLGGLETIVEQFDAMASLPMKMHIEGLVEAASMGAMTSDVRETMIDLYVNGEIGKIMPLVKNIAPAGVSASGSSGEFEEAMIFSRNITMAKRAKEFLIKGNAFIAVGAMHLPSEKGLVELLRKDGYSLTPLER